MGFFERGTMSVPAHSRRAVLAKMRSEEGEDSLLQDARRVALSKQKKATADDYPLPRGTKDGIIRLSDLIRKDSAEMSRKIEEIRAGARTRTHFHMREKFTVSRNSSGDGCGPFAFFDDRSRAIVSTHPYIMKTTAWLQNLFLNRKKFIFTPMQLAEWGLTHADEGTIYEGTGFDDPARREYRFKYNDFGEAMIQDPDVESVIEDVEMDDTEVGNFINGRVLLHVGIDDDRCVESYWYTFV